MTKRRIGIVLNITIACTIFSFVLAIYASADETGVATPTAVPVALQVSNTPLRVILDTPTLIPTTGVVFTPTPTYTPTREGPAQLRVLGTDPVNVRSLADIESDILGTIRPEETYTVLGKLFMWYQIVFDSSPNGRGWVFEGLVEIIGDPAAVPDLSLATATPQLDPEIAAATQTQEALNVIPGGELTATANSRVIAPPSGDIASGVVGEEGSSNALPTFTYPPNLENQTFTLDTESNEATPVPNPAGSSSATSEGIAPIVPIVVLLGFGLIGLLVSSLRR